MSEAASIPVSIAVPAPATSVFDRPALRFAVRRLLRFVVSLWVLVTAAFGMIYLIPGDPVRASLGITASQALVNERRHALGLDQPLLVQYGHYLAGLFSGNFGTSLASRLPVARIIADRLPATLELAVAAFVLAVVIAIPLGTVMGVLTRGGRARRAELAFTTTSVIVGAIPDFLVGVVLVWIVGVHLHWLPVREHLEQQLGSGPAERQVAKFVADQQVRAIELRQHAVELVLLLRLLQPRHQGRRRTEAHALALPTSRQPQGNGQVRLAGARTADQTGVGPLLDPVAPSQFQHLGLAQRRHGREVEGVEILGHREAGRADACLHGIGSAGGDFQFGQAQQVLLVVFVGSGRLTRQFLELGADRRQLAVA